MCLPVSDDSAQHKRGAPLSAHRDGAAQGLADSV